MKSMTGFGRAEEIRETWSLRVEVKSLNHRFLEIIPRLPRRYQGLEEKIRRGIRERFLRGRFEILVQIVGQTVMVATCQQKLDVKTPGIYYTRAFRLDHHIRSRRG